MIGPAVRGEGVLDRCLVRLFLAGKRVVPMWSSRRSVFVTKLERS